MLLDVSVKFIMSWCKIRLIEVIMHVNIFLYRHMSKLLALLIEPINKRHILVFLYLNKRSIVDILMVCAKIQPAFWWGKAGFQTTRLRTLATRLLIRKDIVTDAAGMRSEHNIVGSISNLILLGLSNQLKLLYIQLRDNSLIIGA